MLTIARCTRAAVWTQVMGFPDAASVDQSLEARDTLLSPREPPRSLFATVDESLSTLGMECCWTHSSAYSQERGLGRKTFAARVRQAT
jgi:hypothetical protein